MILYVPEMENDESETMKSVIMLRTMTMMDT